MPTKVPRDSLSSGELRFAGSASLSDSFSSRCREALTTAVERLATVSHLLLVTGGRYEIYVQAHRVDTPCRRCRSVRSMAANLCPRASASGEGRGSGTREARPRLAAGLLPVETWRLPLAIGPLGAPSGQARNVGLSTLAPH